MVVVHRNPAPIIRLAKRDNDDIGMPGQHVVRKLSGLLGSVRLTRESSEIRLGEPVGVHEARPERVREHPRVTEYQGQLFDVGDSIAEKPAETNVLVLRRRFLRLRVQAETLDD